MNPKRYRPMKPILKLKSKNPEVNKILIIKIIETVDKKEIPKTLPLENKCLRLNDGEI